jgi:hypothetical protein
MNLEKSIRLQIAADMIANLADAIEELGKQLDKLHAEIGDELYSRVHTAFPIETQFGPKANANLVKLYRELTPPDDYDLADRI